MNVRAEIDKTENRTVMEKINKVKGQLFERSVKLINLQTSQPRKQKRHILTLSDEKRIITSDPLTLKGL